MTIRQTLARREITRPGRWDGWLLRLRFAPLAALLALRNAVRRRNRFIVSVGTLALAGGVFLAAGNLMQAWTTLVDRAGTERGYQLVVRLQGAGPQEALLQHLARDPEVRRAEGWNTAPALWAEGPDAPIARTYPDNGHGSLLLRGAPPDTQLVPHRMLEGRWLAEGDGTGVVVNDAALRLLARRPALGDTLHIAAGGRILALRLLGVSDEAISGPSAYVLPAVAAGALGLGANEVRQLRIALREPARTEALARPLARRLDAAGRSVRQVITETQQREAAMGHVQVLVRLLEAVSLVMAALGAVGLASTLGSGVAERRGELGVLRSLGAGDLALCGGVVVEALAIVLAACIAAALVAWPVGQGLVSWIGGIAGQPLQHVVSWQALGAWLALATTAAVIASLVPAWQATRLPLREAMRA